MEIDKVFSSDVDGVADNLFSAVKNSVSEVKAMQQRKAAENVQLVIQALKKIESDLQDKFDGVTTVIEKRVAAIKDGRDGLDGRNGRDGKDGRPGRDGAPGARGPAGVPGTNGRDGEDGVSVTDARIDFDGSLIISLSSGREINVGEVVAPDLAEKIKVITNGGGTSQSVLDSLASLQAQITALSNLGAVNYVGTWDASTNTPTIVNGTGDKGDYYVVSVAGSTNIDGQTLWGVGDWIIFNGVVWQRVDGGSTGNFTDLSASGVVTLSGGTANGLAYLNGSKVLTTGSTLTFDGSRQIRLNFGGYTDWNTGYNTILVGASTVAGALNSSISHLASNLTDDTGSGGWKYVLSGSRASVLTQSNGTLTWSATTTTGSGGTSAASFLKPIISANFAGAITLNSSSDPGSLTHYGTATISGAVTLSAGTANGVAYLNGSKVLTTGSALTYDGTTLTADTASTSAANFRIENGSFNRVGAFQLTANGVQFDAFDQNSTSAQRSFMWLSGGSEQMRLTSTGLGIGTSSPGARLHVAGEQLIQPTTVANAKLSMRHGSIGNNNYFEVDSSSNTIFGTANAERMRLDASGNLGLGVTPTTGGYGRSFQFTDDSVGTLMTLQSQAINTNDRRLSLTNNAKSSGVGTWAYFNTSSSATMYQQVAGQHAWYTAAPAAGPSISFTQAMTLDASGNLGLGTTSPSSITAGYTTLDIRGSSGGGIRTGKTGAENGLWYTDASQGWFGTVSNIPQVFYTNNTERARIDSSGNLLVGTTSGSGDKIYASGYIRASSGFKTDGTTWIDSPASETMRFVTNNTERARIDSSGNFLVGLTSVAYNAERLTVYKSGNAESAAFINDAGANNYTVAVSNRATTGDNKFVVFATESSDTTRGSIVYSRGTGLVTYATTSDYRAKDIIGPVQNTGATIDALKVYEGKMKGATQSRPMLVAHEAQVVAPYCVTGEKDAVDEDGDPIYQQIDVSSLVPLLLAEIQSLRARVAQLEGTKS